MAAKRASFGFGAFCFGSSFRRALKSGSGGGGGPGGGAGPPAGRLAFAELLKLASNLADCLELFHTTPVVWCCLT